MEIAITTMSANGQVVIPAEIRKEANLPASTKFLVCQEKGVVLLKRLDRTTFGDDLKLIERLAHSEAQLKKGEYITIPADTPAEEIDRILMAHRWSSSTQGSSTRRTRKSRTKRRG